MESIAFASIRQLREKIAKKELSREELLDYSLKRFEQYDKQLLSALEIFDRESILTDASQEGLLYGIPGIIKDNICQNNRITACASKILANYRAPYDATVTTRLKKQGALSVGRANCDEFAMGSSGETSAYQKTRNPWNFECVPGGSSSGSIAAVAAGLVPWALGTETGGSVRLPAAFCGIVGLKPTYGLVSRFGLVAYASSLDQAGIATRTVYDNALVLSAIAGHDSKDSTTLPVEKKDYTQQLTGSLKKGLRIGVVENLLHAPGMDPEIVQALEDALKVYEKLGAHITRITLPVLDYSAAVYFIISRAEAASNLARFDGVRYGVRSKNAGTLAAMYANTRHDGFGPEVRARILLGNYVLSAGYAEELYNNAKKIQRMIQRNFKEAFREVDTLFLPVHPAPAFKFGAFDQDKLTMDLQDLFTCPINLAGSPALAVPCGFTKDKLPIGFQLAGPHLSEDLIFQTAYAYEQATPWHTMHPPSFV